MITKLKGVFTRDPEVKEAIKELRSVISVMYDQTKLNEEMLIRIKEK